MTSKRRASKPRPWVFSRQPFGTLRLKPGDSGAFGIYVMQDFNIRITVMRVSDAKRLIRWLQAFVAWSEDRHGKR